MALARNGMLRRRFTAIVYLGLAGCSWHAGLRTARHNPAAASVITEAVESDTTAPRADVAENRDAQPENSESTLPAADVGHSPVADGENLDWLVAGAPASEKVVPTSASVAQQTPPPAVQPQPQNVYDINFSTALALASGRNPRVAFAQHRISEAFARLDAAEVLWLPSIRAGASYNKHEGSLQDVEGNMFQVSRSSAYSGFGAQAVGTGSPAVSGLRAQFHLADAIFQPIIAERTAAAEQYAATATANDVLLEAALAYLELLRANQQRAIADETARHAQLLADLTAAFSEAGQGSEADADRARAELALRKNNVTRAEEATAVASARLTEVLSLDSPLTVQPTEPTVAPIELVSLDSPVQELLADGLMNRPELSQNRLLVSQAVQRLQREKYAPLIPSVLLGFSYGGFGGGTGSSIDNYRDRMDFDAVAFWEVRNLGFGEKAARDEARARVCQARFREVEMMNRVAREITEAWAQARARKRQISVAESGIEAARASYNRNLERIRQNEGLPLEVLQSIQALDEARREYLRAVTDYNAAQFRLYRALGYAIEE